MGALRLVQGRAGRVPKDTKSLSDLVFRDETREALTMVLNRLRNAHHIEELGGTLPRGVMFHGLSGAGKTAAARALAKDAGWAFLSCAGPDLVADRKKLQAVFDEAADIRPTLLFIDEADDLLRNRQYSSTSDLCNKLLTLMDGVEGPVKDVVIIAATNNPDQVDPALLRAGRFTEKVEFLAPPDAEIPRYIARWVKAKRIALADGLDAFDIAEMLKGQTIANVEGVLQYALNRAIHSHAGPDAVIMRQADMEAAVRVVLPEQYQ
jgi:transitional endoplasmic reticulum ATPase